MSGDDEYRTVTFTLRKINGKSVMLTRRPKDEQWQSCPRSCIHGGDDLLKIGKIKDEELPKEVTVRMFAWKADGLHLAGE